MNPIEIKDSVQNENFSKDGFLTTENIFPEKLRMSNTEYSLKSFPYRILLYLPKNSESKFYLSKQSIKIRIFYEDFLC